MVLKELKRQTFSLGMLLALIVGLIMLTVGRFPDLKTYFALGLKIEYDYMNTLTGALTSGGFLVFTPLIVVLPGVIQFCDDYNYGYTRLIITRVSKKNYLMQRYGATIIAGGIACMLPLLVVTIYALLTKEPPTDYYSHSHWDIYNKFVEMWDGKAVMFHICLMGFIFGMVWASIGIMFAVIIPNRYVALGLPVAIFFVANIICNLFMDQGGYKFSPVNMIYVDVQDSMIHVIVYQTVLLLVSGVIYLLVGNRRLKNA